MKTVALYGGSFDPPHIAHEAIVMALTHLDFVDKIVVMPTFLSPFKDTFHASASMRLQWLQKIFADVKKVEVSSFEVDKQRSVPSLETVEYLLQRYDKVYLVIGADNLSSLHHWHNFKTLQKKVEFIVATRENSFVSDEYIKLPIDIELSSSQLRKKIELSKLPKKCAQEIANYYKEHNAKKN